MKIAPCSRAANPGIVGKESSRDGRLAVDLDVSIHSLGISFGKQRKNSGVVTPEFVTCLRALRIGNTAG